jgi:hypothetical protein
MPDHSKQFPGHLLQELLEHWRYQHRKRAEGGWWSLAGFSFQASVFLLRFFRQLENGTTEPGQLAEMEKLSDILCPLDGRLTLIQVKRTLDRRSLVAALEEAYLITDLCRRETPVLLGRLRFQIACRKKDTPLNVADLSMSDVTKADGDTESWQAMLSQFDALSPIIEEPDTLDQLHLYLWNAGVQDTTLLIEQCAGRMLNSFDMPGPQAIRTLGRDLRSSFFEAQRRNNWIPIGRVLTLHDITPDEQASRYTGVLTGQVPKFDHLRKGYLRDRPQIFQSLWTIFTRWLSTLDSCASELSDDRIPVFWISGRSGEGKSVLLLQLIAEFLKSVEAAPTVQLKSGNDLPRLIETVPEPGQLSDPAQSRIFCVIDDVYDLRDREGWGDEIGNACLLRTPPLAIITCGPTEQREQFTSHLIGQFNVAHFEVPTLDMAECLEFLNWYEARTGKTRDLNNLTTENVLLVLFMFELAQGMRLPEFAQRFKRRLLRLNVFEVARAILAVNALYIDAPLALIKSDKNRDALARLCERDQLHFRVTPAENGSSLEGVHLAHAHLAWLLFVEWVEPPTTLAKSWARELAKAIIVIEGQTNSLAAANLLHQLLTTTRLSDTNEGDPSSPPTANRLETIPELYRVHIRDHGGRPSLATLPRWLDFAFKIPRLNPSPDPVYCAVAEFSNPLRAANVDGSVAAWVWRIAESRHEPEAGVLRNAVEDFLTRFSNNSGVGVSLGRISARPQNEAKEFISRWIALNPTHPQAYWLIAPLVAANPANAEMIMRAVGWLNSNSRHPEAYQLIAPLVAANPANSETIKQAIDWLNKNPSHPHACQVIAPLVAANSTNASVVQQAIDWLRVNSSHPRVNLVIDALVAANSGNSKVFKQAFDWLLANRGHKNHHDVIAALITANPKVETLRLEAFNWLASNANHLQAHHVITALIAANPNDVEVTNFVTDWLETNPTHTHAYYVIAALVAANPASAEVKERAIDWLDANSTHPQAYKLIATILTANAPNAEMTMQAIDWLAANPTHPQAYNLLPPLVKAGKAAPTIIDLVLNYLTNAMTQEHHDYVLPALARALVDNLANAMSYLNGTYTEERKRLVCDLIGKGMKPDPDMFARFLYQGDHHISAGHLHSILKSTVIEEAESDNLNAIIAQWLNENFREPVYREMLNLFKQDYHRWVRIEGLGYLRREIEQDFDALLSAQ